MSGVDEILSYKKNPDEDFYALLNCDEHSSVSYLDKFWEFPERKSTGRFQIIEGIIELSV